MFVLFKKMNLFVFFANLLCKIHDLKSVMILHRCNLHVLAWLV